MNSDAEQAVLRAIERLGGLDIGVNELSVSYACPTLDVYEILRVLADRGIVEHKGAVVRIVPESDRKPTVPVEEPRPRNEPRKPRKPRKPQFARLDHSKNLVKQVASRIVEFLSHAGPVKNEVLYNALYAYKFRAKYFGRDLWLEALKYLGRSIRIKDGMTELVNEMVSEKLPKGESASQTETSYSLVSRCRCESGSRRSAYQRADGN